MATYTYTKGEQVKKYLGQVMRAFAGFQVQAGPESGGTIPTKAVPVVYGSMSRVVADVLNNRDFMANRSLPIMAVNMTGMDIDTENQKNRYHSDDRAIRNPTTGETEVFSRMTGPALVMNIELSIYASSSSELFDLVEQILLVFNPKIAIQKSSDVYDSNYITDIVLNTINPEISYPMGTDNRTVLMTLGFSVPIRLSYPSGADGEIIERIQANVVVETGDETISSVVVGDPDTGEITIEGA